MLILGIASAILIGAFLGYSKYCFYPNLFSHQTESLNNAGKVVSLTIKNALRNGSSNEPAKFGPIFADIKNSALNKYLNLNEDNAPLDYVAFYYYSKSSNVEQFFETSIYNDETKPDFKGEDCYKVLKVPDYKKAEVAAYLKKAYINLDNFVCRLEDHKSFVGYVIDKDPVKKYLYFRTLHETDTYRFKDNLKKREFRFDGALEKSWSRVYPSLKEAEEVRDTLLNTYLDTDTVFEVNVYEHNAKTRYKLSMIAN